MIIIYNIIVMGLVSVSLIVIFSLLVLLWLLLLSSMIVVFASQLYVYVHCCRYSPLSIIIDITVDTNNSKNNYCY